MKVPPAVKPQGQEGKAVPGEAADNGSDAAAGTKQSDPQSKTEAPPLTGREDDSTPSPVGSASGLSSTSSSSEEQEENGEEEEEDWASSSESDEVFASVLDRLKRILHLKDEPGQGPPAIRPSPLPRLDLEGVAEFIKQGKAKKIICMCGAGVSCSAGIPDFRTAGTGLYSRLEEYDLPHPQAIFELDFFKSNPYPFYTLVRELYPGNFDPTPTHRFIRKLADRGLLQRCYTQNIDSLEVAAGVPRDLVIAAHGNFDTASCIRCGQSYSPEFVRAALFPEEDEEKARTHPEEAEEEARELAQKLVDASKKKVRMIAPPYCGCGGMVKPDIVMFGENLPDRFWDNLKPDFAAADLLIVMGTSLVVQPFASLIDKVQDAVPRLLINRERVGEADISLRAMGWDEGFDFSPNPTAWRDVLFLGDCDDGVLQLETLLGWD